MRSKFEKARRGESVVYSLEAHREFVQGFRKRKQERRQKAKADIEEAEKQARRDSRREKREFIRANRATNTEHDSSSDDDEAGDETQVTTFAGKDDSVVTAIVQPMEINKFEAPRRSTPAGNDTVERGEEQPKDAEQKDDEQEPVLTTLKRKLGVKKTLRKHGKRRVSYTHAMSKGNLRKKRLKLRKEAKKS